MHESLLKSELSKKGLGRDEVDAYLTRFDGLKPPTARDNAIKRDLEDVKMKSGDDIRNAIATRARDKAVDRFKASDVSPRDAYDNLVARGIVKPKIEKGVDVNRPAADAKWSKDPKDTSPANPQNWDVVPAKGADAKRISQDPLVSKADFKTNVAEVRKDTERRQYLSGAYEKYKAWAMADPGNPPNYDKGLGMKDEAEVRKRFDKLTTQLKLTNSDGTPDAFDPNATGENDPAQAFFPVKDGEIRFNEDGTLKSGVKFRHENPIVDDSAVNPVTRVMREQTTKDLQRDTLFASLTGQVPEGIKERDRPPGFTLPAGHPWRRPQGPDGRSSRKAGGGRRPRQSWAPGHRC
jgi:hypothetical protein